MTHLVHTASLNNLTHEVLIDMNKRVQAHKWCEKNLGRAWEPFDYREGRWNMVWGGHDSNLRDMTNFDKYKVCFEDEQDMLMFKSVSL